MTQAYLEGFKKTAEAHGIDPELLKKAQSAYMNGQLGPTLDAAEDNAFLQLMKNPALAIKLDKLLDRSNGLENYLSGPGHYFLKEKMNDKDFSSLLKLVSPEKMSLGKFLKETGRNMKDGGSALKRLLLFLNKGLDAAHNVINLSKNVALGTGGAVAGGLAGYAGYKLLGKNKKKEKSEKKASYDALLKLAQQALGATGPRVNTAKLDSMAQLMRSPQTDIQFEKALPSEGMLRYLSRPGHKDAFNAAFAKAWAAAKNRSTNPKIPDPGTAPKAPLHIAQPPKVPAVKLPQPK